MSTLPDTSVLDVGAAGLEGDNTTDYLIDRFQDYTGICIKPDKVEAYKQLHPEANILVGDFYTTDFDRTFDVIVLDLNIDNNIHKDWTDEGLARVRQMLNPGGYLVNYVMLTTDYGDEKTPLQIKEHAENFWGGLTLEDVNKKLDLIPGYRYHAHFVEERRPYILWLALKRTDG